ncbi:MAG: choice-of-anchor I family protein [Campylobacterota bacterium]|nr:choice-of-anchor I family protein [Campylobacterota bacterium]
MKTWLSLAASTALVVTMVGCSDDGSDGTNGVAGIDGANGSDGISSVSFNRYENNAIESIVKLENIPVPTGDEQKTINTSSSITFGDEFQAIGFNKLLATADVNNGEIFGLLKDYQDKDITFSDGSPYICNGTNSGVGSGLDYTSILQKNNKLYMVSQFECQVGAIYKAELEQDATTGKLSVKENSLEFISQKEGFGGFVHCAGQTTPWQSHLGSEEYEPNARAVLEDADESGLTGNKYYDEVAKYWGDDIAKASPYYYGWTPEVTIDSNGAAVYTKHYSLGRMSHELSYVMPDRKTVYMSDDGTNVGLFMFVADKAEDLSAGTIYAAKWIQKDGANGGDADLSWIKLGHSSNAEIKAILDADNNVNTNDAPLFTDIFETAQVADDNSCPTGFTSVNTSAYQECLKVKTGQETAAAFLETRRYAALMGATTEFRKEEGITYSPEHGKLFVAMSAVAYGMEDNKKKGSAETKYDIGGNNDIRVPYNPCGAVYALDVANNTQPDMAGNDIDSSYVVNNMYAILTGEPTNYPAGHPYEGNTCSVNGISNPDNVTYLEDSNLLFIGEDTSSHLNNMIWAYDLTNGKLTRTLTTPLDAETTSPFWYKNINGFTYMTAVTQHPMEDVEGASDSQKESFVGVMGPIKGLDSLSSSLVKVGAYNTGLDGGSEISAYDATTKQVFITNGADNTLDILDISTVKAPVKKSSIDLSAYGAGIQSVATSHGNIAVAVASADKVATKGKVVIFNTDGTFDKEVTVGYLPDMLGFSRDGTKVIVANEGEPDASSGIYEDVNGTVGIITVATGVYNEVAFVAGDLNNAADGTPVRLGGTPSNNTALDMEPEFVAVAGDKAYVTLQENNALAIIDIATATPSVDRVKSFGAKDYSSQNKIDIEEEGKILFKNYPGLKGLYQPDTIVTHNINGTNYLFTANEGDGREYEDSNGDVVFIDEDKIKNLTLDSSIADAYSDENDLKVMTDISTSTELYTYGGRSFSIWDTNGDLVWDSGDAISKLVAENEPKLFNQDDAEIDGRSGNKGAEPEAIAVGTLSNGKVYAFVGLERQSAIVIYDVSNPQTPVFVDYVVTHTDNDISPEGMKFISASDAPNSKDLLLVSYEVSGSTVIYEVK